MTDDNDELHYPNLTGCRVSLTSGSAACSKPPVHLPSDVLTALQDRNEENVYDFSLERAVLQKQEEQDKQSTASCSRQELEHNLIVQMKSVTGAGDDVCGSTLESNGYDLKTSIEAFYVQR